jgi:hypothetical protein
VYLSFCLAMLSAASRQGVWLPLVLDEPFARLEARSLAALAMVLESFSRRGHQVLVFTRQKEAAERLIAVGADVREMIGLRRTATETAPAVVSTSIPRRIVPASSPKLRNGQEQTSEARPRKKKRVASPREDGPTDAGHSDAA